jgi:hypothetical protein
VSALEELEAALRVDFQRDTLLVYADELLSAGDDVRGELIQLDLAEPSDERAARRAELITAWLGRRVPNGAIRYGFLDVDATSAKPWEQLAEALDRPAVARYVRGVTVCGDRATVARAIAQIAAAPRPWLARVSLRQWPRPKDPNRPPLGDGVPEEIDDTLATAFVRATHALHALELDGGAMFPAGVVHPNVRRVRVSGYAALASLHDADAPWHLTSLDFAMCGWLEGRGAPGDLGSLLPARVLPELVHLDLSRNEPGHDEPRALGGTVDPFQLLAGLGVRRQLHALRVPALRDHDAVENLRAALRDMPALRELDIRGTGLRPRLEHASATIRFVP